jgi:protease-4
MDSPGSGAGQGAGSGSSVGTAGLIERVLLATIIEQRRARRWRIFFRFAYLGVAALALVLFFGLSPGGHGAGSSRHTALVEIKGVLDADTEASADLIVEALQAAFAHPGTAGVILRINSPGGSPVQAGIVYNEVRRLREKHPDKPLHAVVEEICASGGYYVAAAADQIFVDRASIIGSIGVLMDGFGFVGAMDKLGVERRLLTAGENKGFMDSFSPIDDRQRKHAEQLLSDIHRQFIDAVKAGRGSRLKTDAAIFSGLVWTGERGLELGLADALGSVDHVAREVIKAEHVVDFSRHENFADRVARRVCMSAGQAGARALSGMFQLPSLR